MIIETLQPRQCFKSLQEHIFDVMMEELSLIDNIRFINM